MLVDVGSTEDEDEEEEADLSAELSGELSYSSKVSKCIFAGSEVETNDTSCSRVNSKLFYIVLL